MSGAVGSLAGAAGGSTLALVIADATGARQRLDTLTTQAGSGHVAETFGGLGAAAGRTLSLRPALAGAAATQADIDAATGRMKVAQTALSGISSVLSTFYADTAKLPGTDANQIDSVAAAARDALANVAGLLNTRDGDVYVFAGQDSANPPVPNPDQITGSGFFTQIQAAVAGLSGTGAAALIASTLATASSNAAGTSPFSAALSQPAAALAGQRASVQTGPGQRVATGVLASANGDVVSTGANTTGSYIRDGLRALATLASLSSGQAGVAGFSTVVQDVRTTLSGAIGALGQDAGVMGDRQSALVATQTRLADTASALQAQVSSLEDVDMAKTLTDLSAAQTRLQSSYQLIAGLRSLSLTNYLT